MRIRARVPLRHMALICAQSVFYARFGEDLLWETDSSPFLPTPGSQTNARTQPGHYVKRQGKPNARKVWLRNPWHVGKRPGGGRGAPCLRLTSQQKVKGLPLHPSLLKTVFSERGKAGSLKIYSHAHATAAPGSPGRIWENGTKLA